MWICPIGFTSQDENIALSTNKAVQTDRDWGSTMKPITDCNPAIEKKCLYKHWYDITINLTISQVLQHQFYNWDRKYYGSISLTYAIQQSRNATAVKALQAVRLDLWSFLKF